MRRSPGRRSTLRTFAGGEFVDRGHGENRFAAELLPRAAAPTPLQGTLEAVERKHILQALRAAEGVIGGAHGAAARLGMNRNTLHSKMRKLGITRPRY